MVNRWLYTVVSVTKGLKSRSMLALSPARQTLLLFLLALAVLIPGIWEATGLTGKDEFFRSPRHWSAPASLGFSRQPC